MWGSFRYIDEPRSGITPATNIDNIKQMRPGPRVEDAADQGTRNKSTIVIPQIINYFVNDLRGDTGYRHLEDFSLKLVIDKLTYGLSTAGICSQHFRGIGGPCYQE